MRKNALYRKIFIGIIFFISLGVFLTHSVQSQESPITALPLTPISSFDQPKPPASNVSHTAPITSSPQDGDDNIIPIPIPEADLLFEKECTPTDISLDETIACTVTITNLSTEDYSYRLFDLMVPNLSIIEDTVEGGDLIRHYLILNRGTLAGGTLPSVVISDTNKPIAYNSLADLGIPPLPDVEDDSVTNLSTLNPYIFNNEEYTTVGMTSNGYLIAGLGSDEDIAYVPQIFPDAEIPNNVIAPLWTDLNPEAGGNLYAALLFRDEQSWAVFEWEDVPAYSSDEPKPNCVENCDDLYTFQVWIETSTPAQDITFIYEHIGGEGAPTGLNVGSENIDGTLGGNYPTIPLHNTQVSILNYPGTAGETHEITYTAEPLSPGPWFGCAVIKIFSLNGVNYDCVYGNVTE